MFLQKIQKNHNLLFFQNAYKLEISINQMFDSKYKMRNVKKTQQQRFASVQLKKAVSVIKCFICNQMYYSQSTFDQHMKHHSSKLTRQIPEQIQRKTMQSFRVNKNKMNNNIRSSTANDKKILNQTANVLRKKIEQNDKAEEQEIKYNKQQIQEAEQALKQSTLLIQKIQALTHDDQSQIETPQKSQQKLAQKNIIKKNDTIQQYTQQQLVSLYLQGKQLTIKMIQCTNFQNQYLISCHDQLSYLNQIVNYMDKAVADLQKVEKMKKQILGAIVQYFRQNTVELPSQKNNSIYITDKQQNIKIREDQMQIVENIQVSYCNQCYMEIQFGEDCYQQKDQKGSKNNDKNKYHIDCWEQNNQNGENYRKQQTNQQK